MTYGIQIYMPQLNTISVAKDKNLVTIGGGTNSKKVIDALWAAGKQTGMPSSVLIYIAFSNCVQSPDHANASVTSGLRWEVVTDGFKAATV
jgi:hypothetical protein